MFRKIISLMSFILLFASVVLAQTGRISGTVIDQQTGEPLVGTNVIVMGTNYGSTTDANGNFLITQVPVGVYDVRASYIGYQTVTIQNIRVVSGLTAEVNFKLPSSDIVTSEVVIVSQRPLIEKSATNAVRIVSAEDLTALPVRSLNDYVAIQPGVVRQNGMTFIRGSRPDETGYILEGADIKNILNRNGGFLVTSTPDALQEVLVQAGGFTAEYGNANAGIIQQDFKTGTDKYHFSLRLETDNFGNYPGDQFLDTYSYGYSDYTFTVSGPVTNKLKLFLSGENYFIRDYSPMFFDANPLYYSDGARFDNTKVYDSGIYGGKTTEGQILTWSGGNIPGRFQNRYTLNGTALLDMKPLIVRLAGAYTWQRTRTNDPNVINLFDTQRLPINDATNLLLNLKANYFISAHSYLEANVNFFDQRGKTYDPYFEDNFPAYSDSLLGVQYGWTYYNRFSSPVAYDFYGFPFNRPGAVLTGYSKSQNNYIGGSIAYTAQVSNHELKIGGSFQRWTVRSWANGAPATFLSTILQQPDKANNPDSLLQLIGSSLYFNFNNYGYDPLGRETDAYPFGPKHPVIAAGYVQDKLELSDLIINAGLRFDYIDMDTWKWVNPLLPVVNRKDNSIPQDQLTSSTKYSYISPRLGFSFPVTDQTVFHLQYGKFIQSPSLDQAYRGIYQSAAILTGSNLFTNPIAYDPEPIRTTQYEIGFSQQFTDFAAFDLTAFYKDIKGQLQYGYVYTLPGAPRAQYAVFQNQDFSTTKGIELSLKIRRVERIRAEINYTFSDASGTNSFSNSAIGSLEVNKNAPTVLLPLDYNQTHRGAVMLDYRWGKDDGGPILEQLGFNLLFTFNSGHPFTFAEWPGLGQSQAWTGGLIPATDTRGRRPIGPPNSSTTPWVYNLDLRVDKTVSIFNLDVNFYVYVQNLLNTKNVINVYDFTGNAFDDGFLNSADGQQIISQSRYTERFADLYNALNLTNRQHILNVKGVDLFGTPRQLRVGAFINF
ncbi:TonB-dependent receptor domain-containing protein [Melioribacteraceae bacterium 4301-Me]|uniref:TonB-dependent receptor n=1 Tax=Pyranulibacter aquaticus TaxID=3163344 RepID=UPI00359A2C57